MSTTKLSWTSLPPPHSPGVHNTSLLQLPLSLLHSIYTSRVLVLQQITEPPTMWGPREDNKVFNQSSSPFTSWFHYGSLACKGRNKYLQCVFAPFSPSLHRNGFELLHQVRFICFALTLVQLFQQWLGWNKSEGHTYEEMTFTNNFLKHIVAGTFAAISAKKYSLQDKQDVLGSHKPICKMCHADYLVGLGFEKW